MSDVTMCTFDDCPLQDNCWRLNAPPEKKGQKYHTFNIDLEEVVCNNYIPMDEIDFNLDINTQYPQIKED